MPLGEPNPVRFNAIIGRREANPNLSVEFGLNFRGRLQFIKDMQLKDGCLTFNCQLVLALIGSPVLFKMRQIRLGFE